MYGEVLMTNVKRPMVQKDTGKRQWTCKIGDGHKLMGTFMTIQMPNIWRDIATMPEYGGELGWGGMGRCVK